MSAVSSRLPGSIPSIRENDFAAGTHDELFPTLAGESLSNLGSNAKISGRFFFFTESVKELLDLKTEKPLIGPFSLAQAEDILARAYCPYCKHELGVKNEQLEKKMCLHQFLASDVITKNRKLAEQNLEFRSAAEMVEISEAIQ
jgi:hypothetical protein